MRRGGVAALAGLTIMIAGQSATAQDDPNPVTPSLQSEDVAFAIDSGFVRAEGAGAQVVFETEVASPGASWLRVRFDEALLAGEPGSPDAAFLMITSHLDGATQLLDARSLAQWQNTSAYFNGDRVTVELVAFPDTGPNRLVITSAIAGLGGQDVAATICGNTDDRMLSEDPRAGRALPVGCTAWLINDCQNCLLTAGHCQGGADVIQFNVPLSNGEGGINHPPPEDQYARDPQSLQGNGGQGTGNDWAYFGCFPNSNTGLTPAEAQGAVFDLADEQPPVQGQDIRITGYGTVSPPVPPQWNLVQKTHAGPFVTSAGSLVQYRTDTTGGNSGSPVIDESTGEAIGIHTHGGCTQGGGANTGTGISHSGLVAALDNPIGVCECPGLIFDFPGGLPEIVDPAGGTTFQVIVAPDGLVDPEPGTGMLHFDAGEGFQAVPMTEISDGLYEAEFPAIDCPSSVAFYVSAESTDGDVYASPEDAPGEAYPAVAATGTETIVHDDLEADSGWTVGAADDDATTGIWERVNPIGTDAQPENDHSPGGTDCFVTGQGELGGGLGDADIDNGKTTLFSPVIDLSGATTADLSYCRWYDNSKGAAPGADVFVIDVSNDAGQTWVNAETVGPTGDDTVGGWRLKILRITDLIEPTDSVMLRFTASDEGQGSVVEAAIDEVKISSFVCDDGCAADFNDDGELSVLDFVAFQEAFVNGDDAADFNDDGELSVLDFVAFQQAFVAGCG